MTATPKRNMIVPSMRETPLDLKPRTELGRRLMEIRQSAIDSGEPLLDWEDLEREIAERRGERRD